MNNEELINQIRNIISNFKNENNLDYNELRFMANINKIRTIINKYLNKLSGQFQIILDKPFPIENLHISIEKSQKTSSLELEILKSKLISEFKNNLHLMPHLDFVAQGSLTADGTKSKIFKKNY